MPGLVSTLLNQTYSVPSRLVHVCLQVTEQVWQPMHLSRFITIATWARMRMSVLHFLAAPPDDGDLVALAADRAVVVEGVGQLRVPARQVRGLDEQPGHRVVVAAALALALAAFLGLRDVHGALGRVVLEHRALGH